MYATNMRGVIIRNCDGYYKRVNKIEDGTSATLSVKSRETDPDSYRDGSRHFDYAQCEKSGVDHP